MQASHADSAEPRRVVASDVVSVMVVVVTTGFSESTSLLLDPVRLVAVASSGIGEVGESGCSSAAVTRRVGVICCAEVDAEVEELVDGDDVALLADGLLIIAVLVKSKETDQQTSCAQL